MRLCPGLGAGGEGEKALSCSICALPEAPIQQLEKHVGTAPQAQASARTAGDSLAGNSQHGC